MLVLTRKVGETIVIGDVIKVTVLDVNNRIVRIGVDAPATVSVNRQEIHDRIQKEKAGEKQVPRRPD